MEILESRLNVQSATFKENAKAMEEKLALLRERLKAARDDRSEKAYARHTEQGKLPVRKRLELLLPLVIECHHIFLSFCVNGRLACLHIESKALIMYICG